MLIVNGMRRRTPGGVFLFLLKNCDEISQKQKKDIFQEEQRKTIKSRKLSQSMKRDRKVEELKRTLQSENDLPVLSSRNDLAGLSSSHLGLDAQSSLLNPPPSPVTDCNRENSSDFDTHCLPGVVNMTSPEKGTLLFLAMLAVLSLTPHIALLIFADVLFFILVPPLHLDSQRGKPSPVTYDDDILSMNCDDMDMF